MLYTTFNSRHGIDRLRRLPFGLICVQDIIQKNVDETFADLHGVSSIADYIHLSSMVVLSLTTM